MIEDTYYKLKAELRDSLTLLRDNGFEGPVCVDGENVFHLLTAAEPVFTALNGVSAMVESLRAYTSVSLDVVITPEDAKPADTRTSRRPGRPRREGASVAQVASVPTPPAPDPEPTAPQQVEEAEPPREKFLGVSPIAGRIIAAVFLNEGEYPTTIEEALKITYGEDWETQTITKLSGKNIRDKRTFVVDIAAGEDSVLRKTLMSTFIAMYQVSSKTNKKKPNATLTNLMSKIDFEKRNAAIVSTFYSWGINVTMK